MDWAVDWAVATREGVLGVRLGGASRGRATALGVHFFVM